MLRVVNRFRKNLMTFTAPTILPMIPYLTTSFSVSIRVSWNTYPMKNIYVHKMMTSNSVAKIRYYNKPYESDHWALHAPTDTDKNFIAILKINRIRIGLKLNPTDARGYRGIACLVTEDKSKISSTFNRDYSVDEKIALNTALGIFARAYENFGLIAQISIAGNNSQSVNPDGSVQIGNEKEPSLLHGHIIGRGNPKIAYIGGVTLKGPKAGSEINLRGDGSSEGNTKKEKWQDGEMEIVARYLSTEITKILRSSPYLKKIEIVSIRKDSLSQSLRQKSPITSMFRHANLIDGVTAFPSSKRSLSR